MTIKTQWFKDRLAERRMSQRGLARAMGIDPAAISLTLRGKREMKLTEAAEIARLLGVPAEDVIQNAGVRIRPDGTTLQIVGLIDGHGEVHCRLSDPVGSVPHPGADLPERVNAMVCKTSDSHLEHMDGWMLFVAEASRGVPADAVGRLSVCRIAGGICTLAKPVRSHERGRWDLVGPSMDAKAVELEFAAPVLLILT